MTEPKPPHPIRIPLTPDELADVLQAHTAMLLLLSARMSSAPPSAAVEAAVATLAAMLPDGHPYRRAVATMGEQVIAEL